MGHFTLYIMGPCLSANSVDESATKSKGVNEGSPAISAS